MASASSDPNDWTNIQWDELITGAEKALGDEQYNASEATLFRALELAFSFGESDIRFIYTLDKLAECLWYRGQLDEAENYCKQLIRIHESVIQANPLDIASFFNNLALLKHAGKNFDEAEKYYKRALKGKEAALGANHPEVLRIKSNYADLLRQRGRNDEAQKLSNSTRVVTVRDWQSSTVSRTLKEADSKNPKSQTNTPRNEDQRDINERRSVSFSREEAMLIWQTNRNAAEFAQGKGDTERAEKIWVLTMRVLETVAEKSVELTYTLDSLAQLAQYRHDYTAAIDYCKRAYNLKLKVLGTRNPVVAQCADMLARLYYMVSDYENAEPFARRCLEFYESMGDVDSIEVGCALHNLATLYHVQRKYTEAEPLYKRALAIKTRAFGEDHPETVRLMRSFGHVLMATQQQEKLAGNSQMQMITGSWKALSMPEAESLLSTEPGGS